MRADSTLLFLLLLALPAGLAGCVKPVEEPSTPPDCEGWSAYWCEEPPPQPTVVPCHDCGAPYGECTAWNGRDDSMAIVCAAPEPPLLAPFEMRRLDACACAGAALAVRNATAFIATTHGLRIEPFDADATVLAAPQTSIATLAGLHLRAPHVHLDEAGRAWYAALGERHGARVVMLGRWDGGETWTYERALDVLAAPMLPLVERVWLASSGSTLLVVLASADAAWALRSLDDGATFLPPESLTPPGGAARFGAPSMDHRGRVLVPFAFDAMAIDEVLSPATLAYASPRLHYAAYDDGAWSFHGGAPAPQGVASSARPALAAAEAGATFAWVDAAGAVARLDVPDDGAGWGTPTFWTQERATGAPAISRDTYEPPCDDTGHCVWQPRGARVTAAWWQDDGALVVARSVWQEPPHTERVVVASSPGAEAALALSADGSAVVAWVDEGALWLARERRT